VDPAAETAHRAPDPPLCLCVGGPTSRPSDERVPTKVIAIMREEAYARTE